MLKTITITHKTGIHARPAGLIAKEAGRFTADVVLLRGDKVFNAKSIMAVLGMGAVCGETLGIRATGQDAEAAVSAMVAVFDRINAE